MRVLYSVGHFILFSFCEPLCVWLTLQRDSEYWRGHTSKLGKSGGGNLNLPLVGRVSLNEGAASTLADTLDAMQVGSILGAPQECALSLIRRAPLRWP